MQRDGMRRGSMFGAAAIVAVGFFLEFGGVRPTSAEPAAAPKSADPESAASASVDAPSKPAAAAGAPSQDELRKQVEKLAGLEFEGRSGDGGKRAAEYLAAQFHARKGRPAAKWVAGPRAPTPPKCLPEEYFQPIELALRVRAAAGVPGGAAAAGAVEKRVVGRNVVAFWPGSDEKLQDDVLVLTAHYDHLGMRAGRLYPGADDNASGVGAMLEAARLWTTLDPPPKRSLLCIAFDLEEAGLVGSRYWVDHPSVPLEKLRLAVNLDMIGRHAFGVKQPFVFVVGSEHAPDYRARLRTARGESGLELGFVGADLVGERSDHAPFWKKGIPFLFLSTSEHPDYHQPSDTPDRIDFDKLTLISSLVVRTLHAASLDEALPPFQKDPLVDLEEVTSVRRVLEHMLKEPAKMPGGFGAQALAQNALLTLRVIEARGKITADERKWLLGVCEAVLQIMR